MNLIFSVQIEGFNLWRDELRLFKRRRNTVLVFICNYVWNLQAFMSFFQCIYNTARPKMISSGIFFQFNSGNKVQRFETKWNYDVIWIKRSFFFMTVRKWVSSIMWLFVHVVKNDFTRKKYYSFSLQKIMFNSMCHLMFLCNDLWNLLI